MSEKQGNVWMYILVGISFLTSLYLMWKLFPPSVFDWLVYFTAVSVCTAVIFGISVWILKLFGYES